MRRWLPSHLRRFPLKYKTWPASAESMNPKQDRLAKSDPSKPRGEPPAAAKSGLRVVRFCCSIPKLLLLFLERVFFPDTG